MQDQALVSTKHQAVVLPFRQDIKNLLPNSLVFDYKGKPHLRINYGWEEVKLLLNLGIHVESQISTEYDWAGTTPFESQKDTAVLLTTNRRAYVLSSMGVGKTRAALYAYDFLRSKGAVEKCLVAAPLSTLVPVWDAEVFECFHHLNVGVLHGTRAKRLKVLAEDRDIYVINHDGVNTIQKELLAKKFDCVIVDELAVYRNRRTNRWKALKPLVGNAAFAWGLTGAPTPNGPTDAYGQTQLLTPGRMAMSFRAFQQLTMKQVSQFRWVPRKEAMDIVHEAMQPSVRFSLRDCHDLPPLTVSSRDVELSAKQKKAYKLLMSDYVLETKKTGRVKVVNEAGRLNKLVQVGAGFAYNPDGQGEYIDAKSRLRIARDLAQEAEGKVIIFACYKWAVMMVAKVMETICEPLQITGATSKAERDRVFALFKGSPERKILVAHPGCMAHGINLQCASNIIWYTPTHSLETYLQANARITRPGQTQHMNIYHLIASPTEKRIFDKLARNEKVQNVLLDMFESQDLGV